MKRFTGAESLRVICASQTVARVLAATGIALWSAAAVAQVSITTNRNDLGRTGANLGEPTLNTTNVNVAQFGKLFERAVDDEIYAQPLYVANVNVPGVGVRNVVYVTTMRNSVYAFDADDPAASSPLWRRVLINSPSVVPVNRSDVGQACGTYLDFAGNIGIVGTGVIDPTSQTIYFVARTKENGAFVQRLHAFDIATGNNRPGSPVLIQASVQGTGGGSVGGVVSFDPQTQNQRAGLMLLNGVVYIAWASHCDQGPYHGWILGYDAATLQKTFTFNTTPNGDWGGIWQSGQALSADALGNIYAVTGNGDFNATSQNGRNYGTSFLKISPAGAVLDWFTPYDWEALNGSDSDLFHGAVQIPNTNLLVGGGKQGLLYVLDRTNMGHLSNNDGQIVQRFQASTSGRMNGSAVFWNTPTNGPVIYLWPGGDPLKAFRLADGRFQTPAVAESGPRAPFSMPGGIMSLSAFGSLPGTGILWATMSNGGDANEVTQPGILRAFDADNVTRELWTSEQNHTRDTLSTFSKFNPPTIANGKVYVATFSNKLVAYGLLNGPPGNNAPVVNAGADQAIILPATASLSATAVDDGNPNPPGAMSVAWSRVAGPGTVTFTAPNAFSTNASFAVAGTYTLRATVSDGIASGADDVAITVFPVPGTGTGLRAQYFNDAGAGLYFTTPVLTRVDATVDFSWADASPAAGVQPDNFSVRWTGQMQPALTGNYTFTTESNDGVRVWVNNQLLIDNWTDHNAVLNTSGEIALVMNTGYDIRVEYYDHTGPATARLLWTPPGQALQVIPQTRLFPAAPVNQPPIVNAGVDRTITLPNNSVTLNGSASDDGLPAPGTLAYTWIKVSGREETDNPVVFSNPSALTTTVTFPAADTYVLRLAVSDGAATGSDDMIVTVNPAPSGGGTGLQGQYYNGLAFNTLVLTRPDPFVDFNWGFGSPGPGVNSDNFTVRWTGYVQPIVSGSHTFSTAADDGTRLWINGQLVIDNWRNQAETVVNSAPISLTAGLLYSVRLEFYDNTEAAIARLRWSYPGQAQITIPQSRLYPPSGANQTPTVNAGADRTVTLPNSLTLTGTASDDGQPNPPGTLTTTWSRVSGPGTVTFGNASALSTTATFSAIGSYVLRLTASDSVLSTTDDLTVTVTANQAPTVNAGADRTVTLPNSLSLTGTASDDGQPNPPGTLTTTWSRVSGPATVTFSNATALSTTATFSAAGSYVLRLTASDSVLSTSDDLTVTVNAANQAPTVNAGVDRTASLSSPLNLSGTATDDGLPNPPGVLTTTWSRVSGPGGANGVTFGNVNALNTTATFSNVGTYVLRLTASDSVLSTSDDLTVTVSAANQAPTVNAGADGAVTLPNTYTLTGTATDDGLPNPPATLTTTWSRVSGPGAVTFANASALSTAATFGAAGSYVIRLTASDSVLSTSDDLTVTVSAANQAPTVNAGADGAATLPNTYTLTGTATDDGLPNPPAATTTTWSRTSGPGTVTFGNANVLSTTASFSVAGTYVLRLTASDSVLSAFDELTVIVSAANQAPTVNAGADSAIALPNTVSLTGTATDDGLPNPPATLTTTWSSVSGPGIVTFANASALSTTASFSAAGSYVLRLTASDSALSSTDDLTVMVNSAPGVPGSGLTGQYYSDRTLATLRLTRTDPIVDFDWGSGSPGANIPINNFGVVWTGQVQPQVSGQYVFSTVADDGVRLWVNGQLVVDAASDRGASTRTSAPITLTADTNYAIRLEYYERTGNAVIQLRWAYPGQSTQIIPQSRLNPQ